MDELKSLFRNNREWIESITTRDPAFFQRLAKQQKPRFLWIGCSDSRVPANEIVGLEPGEMFVHRNVANVVSSSDMNCLSVLQYAISVLGVNHVIVTGHYGCGGVSAALEARQHGLIDNWLHPVRNIYSQYRAELDALAEEKRIDRLCELNVAEQVKNVCSTVYVQEAWARGHELVVHGWIYDIRDGILKDLGISVDSPAQVDEVFRLPVGG
ncbi:carbonate dehydratase [bacterium]|nr:MAG: carbonate dehydratase [bacterium]